MKITNTTINKLTGKELNDLGLLTLNGELRSRIKGYTRGIVDGTIVFFKNEGNYRVELAETSDGAHTCRIYNESKHEYDEEMVQPLFAINFVK